MSWKKILFLCLSLVFVFGGVFGFGEKVFSAETYTEAKMWYGFSSTNQTNGAAIVKDSSGNLYTQNNSGQVSPMVKWSNGSGKNAQTYYTTYDAKAGKNVHFKSANGQDTYDIVEGSSWDETDARYFEYQARKEAIEESLVSTNTTEQKAAQELAAEEQQRKSDAAANDAAKQNGAAVECTFGNALNLYCWAAKFSNEVVLTGAYLVAGVGGYLFDSVINFSVIEMGKNIKIGNGDYISDAWKIMRDVINIAFIFVLLYIGIMTIIKGFESGTSKMIATVVVVALIINFSLFFTKIIIDSSNIVAINFYNTIKSETPSSTGEWSGVAGAFLNVLQLGTIQSKEIIDIDKAGGDNKFLNIIKVSLGGTIILLVLAIVLFIASLMFVTRYIVLIFVLIASSAAIGSWILPSLKKSIYDKWWGALIGQSFFAPVFLFFLFISLKMTEGMTSSLLQSKNMKWSEIFMGNGAAVAAGIDLIISYLIVVGFLVASIIVSKQLSNMAGSGAGKITGFMGGTALGVAGFAGRNTVGRLGQTAANSTALQNFAAKSRVGMGLLNVSNKVAKGSYDVRGTKTFGAMGVDMGKAGGEGGFQKSMTEAVKKRKDQYATAGELNDNEKIRRDKLKEQLEAASETEMNIIEGESRNIKELEEQLKITDPTNTAAVDALKQDIAAAHANIKAQKDAIGNKTDADGNKFADQIKGLDDAGKSRQKAYLSSVGKRWMKANKIAAAEIRKSEEKKKNQTDIDKIIAGIKS